MRQAFATPLAPLRTSGEDRLQVSEAGVVAEHAWRSEAHLARPCRCRGPCESRLVDDGKTMDRILTTLSHVPYTHLIWALAISETVHNLEEAIWLPAWSQTIGVWHPSIGALEFRSSVIVITLLFYAIFYYFSQHENALARHLMGGSLVMILFNVLVPHLLATMVTTRYAPGVASGVLLNGPIAGYLLWRGVTEGRFTRRTLVIGAVALSAIALPVLLAGLAVGRMFTAVV